MYVFEAPFSVNNQRKDVLIVFYGQSLGSEMESAYALEVDFKKYKAKPEELILVCPVYLKKIINKYLKDKGRFYENLMRFGSSIPVSVAYFDERANLFVERVRGASVFTKNSKSLKRQIIKNGLTRLATDKKDQVILRAPSGTIFIKPSKKEFSEFIKASELGIGASENQFIAYCLLSRMPNSFPIKNIYIDTNSISPYIEAMIFYLTMFRKEVCRVATYHSYGSYEGMKSSKPDYVGDVWLIISASRSNSMGVKMAKDWGLEDEQVLTMLSYTDPDNDRNGDAILLNISNLSEAASKPSERGSLIKVKVIGENFTAEAEKPNSVTVKASHKTRAIDEWIDDFSSSQLVKCNKKITSNDKVNSIYLDCFKYFSNDDDFSSWLSCIVDWYIPAKVNSIVYREVDRASALLKKMVVQKLKENGIENFQILDIGTASYNIQGDGAVVVLMPVTGTGETLLRLNRNLRISGHIGNRIFISPFVAFGSRNSFLNFKNSLVFGPDGFRYQFLSKNEVFVGHDRERSSWDLELEVVESLEGDFWQKRAKLLRQLNSGIKGRIGVPLNDVEKILTFTPDFAFWKPGYDSSLVDPEAVYLTISSILQNLRERPITDSDSDSLFSYVYQHSVLSPENFVRYNDDLIQSCIWRAADSRELDYRSSEQLSKEFIAILNRMVKDVEEGEENAILDILLGIAIGRIQLSSEIIRRALDEYELSFYGKFDHAVILIKYIKELLFGIAEDSSKDSIAF